MSQNTGKNGTAVRENSGVAVPPRSRMHETDKVFDNKPTPFYIHDFAYAQEHGEVDLYRASIRENRRCIEAVQNLIRDNYRESHLHITTEQWEALTAACGEKRANFILANTIYQVSSYEGRYSRSNKEWAATKFDFGSLPPHLEDFRLSSHPVLVDALVKLVRRKAVQKALRKQETEGGAQGDVREIPAAGTPGSARTAGAGHPRR